MPLARQQHNVARSRLLQSESNGFAAIRLHRIFRAGVLRFLQSHHRIVHDRQRILRARIVGSEHHKIAALARRLAHQRTFGSIAIPPAAEKRDDSAFESGAGHKLPSQRRQIAQRIVRVRVIDDHCERLPTIYPLKPPRNARQIEDSFRNRLCGTIARVPRSRRRQHVVHIHVPNQRRPHRHCSRRRHHLKPRSPRRDLNRLGMKIARSHAVRKRHRALLLAEFQKLPPVFIVRVHHRRPRRIRPAPFKQHLLGAEIFFHRPVIVEMVARQVREHSHIKWNPKNALLFQRMR